MTRDTEIKKKLTVTRGEVGGDNGRKGFQELLSWTKPREWVEAREAGGVGWVGGSGVGKMQTTVIQQQ